MFSELQIYDPRDRAIVGAADLGLHLVAPFVRTFRRTPARDLRRILLLRMERIGDLLMAVEAITDVVVGAPSAEIDLVVGSWNESVAGTIPGIHRVETLDAAWLARDGEGLGLPRLLARARAWRSRRYDLAINFEPDIRSQLLLAASGAGRIAGFSSGGGGPLLDVVIPFDPKAHTTDNARRLVAAALDAAPRAHAPRLEITADARERARDFLRGSRPPLVGVHASGGRAIKQWPPERFAEVAARLAHERGATIVLTGTSTDKPLVDVVRSRLGSAPTVDLSGGIDLLTLAAVLEKLDLLVTGDTGPMHLAAAVDTAVVAVFGPSDPARYAPRGDRHRIVRIDLPCSPCNRIRLPPARCVGHTPDCLAGIDVERVFQAAVETLSAAVASS